MLEEQTLPQHTAFQAMDLTHSSVTKHILHEPRSGLVAPSMTSSCGLLLIHTHSLAIVFLSISLNLHKCHPVQCAKCTTPAPPTTPRTPLTLV